MSDKEGAARKGLAARGRKVQNFLELLGVVRKICFDTEGMVMERLEFSPARSLLGTEITPNTWHTIFPLSGTAVILEIKEGPFNPSDPIDLALWAPTEGSAEVSRFLDWAQHARPGESYTP